MTLNDLLQGEPWMDPEERQNAAEFVLSMQQSFVAREIPETPFLVLRVQDCLLHHSLCRRLERALTPGNDPAAFAAALPNLAEQIGKCRDRFRRALKELEDTSAKLAPPPPPPPPPARPFNLPDFYKPILEEVGVDLINDPDFFADEDNHYDLPCTPPSSPDPPGSDCPPPSLPVVPPGPTQAAPSHGSHFSHASHSNPTRLQTPNPLSPPGHDTMHS